ncbi:hemicentin-1-like [Achroia grisella]|uniref:hemicentin-1-like n=1 Tax=Achroia grisella TaxID=688607 RepID=UPI0027D2319E|nr:hemicentin-1-like [Achroia grisella]
MYSKLIVIYSLLTLVYSKSFTIVIDTTDSMEIELNILKANIPRVVNAIQGVSDIENYVIVPFNDPDVGVPVISDSPDAFLRSIYGITTSGGTDCPENPLAGIRKALEVSKKESHIFVFTDAFAKNYDDIDAITYLCRTKRSKVVIFLSGFCHSNDTSLETYKSITEFCSGVILQLQPWKFRESFKYMKEIVPIEWNNVVSLLPSNFAEPPTFTVESYTTDVMITITGEHTSIMIKELHTKEVVEYEIIVHSDTDMVIRVKAEVGMYTANIHCRICTAKLFKRNQLPFQYGFSTRVAKDMRETTGTPLPDAPNYIIISIPANIRITSIKVELNFLDDTQSETLSVEQIMNCPGYYYTNIYVDSKQTFKISILVLSEKISITGSTGVLQPQKFVTTPTPRKPSIEIINYNTLLEFGSNTTISARINGYPKPNTWWENYNGEMLRSETILLEIPYVYITYVTVYNVMSNTTIYCKTRSLEGEDSQAVEIFVNRTATLEVLRTPDNEIFEYGAEGRLYCEISAYPEAIITWYHNDTIIDSNNRQIVLEDNAILIKNMNLENVGEYKCTVSNTVETKCFKATVEISGLEVPKIDLNDSDILLKPGERLEIECRLLKGIPEPVISWMYKSNDDFYFGATPLGVIVEENKIKFSSVSKELEGVYKCLAKNIIGEDTKELIAKVKYAPIIVNSDDDTLTVKETKLVQLQCEVDAIPPARVRWEMSQGDVIVPFNSRHDTDNQNTHRFRALTEDSGNYHCIAENELGRAEKTVKVNVLVPPYIRPEAATIDVGTGDSAMLACNVQHGNPAPKTKWEFIPSGSTNIVLQRGNLNNTLVLRNVNKTNEGYYICIAYNDVGSDSIKIYVRVH